MSDTDVSTACSFTADDLEEPLDDIKTATKLEICDPFLLELVEMGKRAAKARRRAARLMAANAENEKDVNETISTTESEVTSSSVLSSTEEDGNEENSTKAGQAQRSKIPTLLKGYIFNENHKLINNQIDENGNSKIPRPVENLLYLYRKSESSMTSSNGTDESTAESVQSFTGIEASFASSEMITGREVGQTCRDWVSPIPHCDLSTETGSLTVNDSNCCDENENENVRIVAEANGIEVELDMTAFIGGMNLEVNGIKIV